MPTSPWESRTLRGRKQQVRETHICENCAYWAEDGTCRRHAPQLVQKDGGAIWPVVNGDDWCGEYAPERR